MTIDRQRILGRSALALMTIVMVTALLGFSPPSSQGQDSVVTAPGWLEPRALSIVELVGHVPDSYLQGTILSSNDGTGIVVYESGTLSGNRVTVKTKLYPRLIRQPTDPSKRLTAIGCLGQIPHFDHMASTVPASTLRVYDDKGMEITSRVRNLFVTRMGTSQPSANSKEPDRYPIDIYGYGGQTLPISAEGLRIPPSSGCRIWMERIDRYPLTGVFTLTLDPPAKVQVAGVQKGTFQSYIGPGNVGIFQPLMKQMSETYGWRSGRIPLSVPTGANYFLLKFPAMPVDPYTDSHGGPPYLNANRPFAGTYRLSRGLDLSADLTFSAAFPVETAWRDADRAPGAQYLPLTEKPMELATPEYVVAAGIAYNDCFVQGNCPASVLQQIYNTRMNLEIIYLRIAQPAAGGQWVPIRMAGPAWSPSTEMSSPAGLDTGSQQPAARTLQASHRFLLPLVTGGRGRQETGPCPRGWFDSQGRMLGLVSCEGAAE